MKRKNSLLAGICSLALVTSVSVSTVPFSFASASAAPVESNFMLSAVQTEVEYGQSFTVAPNGGYSVEVKAPNGDTNVLSGTTVLADQLGFYTVTYTNGDAKYSYGVYCTTSNEFQLVIDNEAKVPTYVATNASVKLPGAKVGYYEEGEFVEDTTSTVTAMLDDGTALSKDTDGNFDATFANEGSSFVTYSAQVGTGKKFVSKTFEIKVQNDFVDEKAPNLSVTGVPKSGNVNMVVNLPQATATDAYDANVDVKVSVKYKNGNELTAVKKVKVNDDGIVEEVLSADEVFDNKDNMSFYPTAVGEYKVTYIAVDDNGNDSSEWNYTISVSDKKAPVLTVDQTKILAKWGYNWVKKLVDNEDTEQGTVAIAGTALTFEMPEFYDNYDEDDEVKVEFKLKDPESNVVVSFSNINQVADSEGTTDTIEGIDGVTYKFSKTENLVIDLGDYVELKSEDANYQAEGEYTAVYAVQDKAGNRVQRSYTINLTADYEDKEPVVINYKKYEKTVVANASKEVEFTVPSVIATSNADTKLETVYKVVSGSAEVEVAQGEVLKIKKVGADYKIVAKKGEIVITGGEFKFVYSATSDAGNTKTLESEAVSVILPGTAMSANLNVEGVGALDGLTTAQSSHALNGLVVTLSGVTDYAAGNVEVSISDEDGKNLPIEALVYTANQTVVVKDFSFIATKAGKYVFSVRAYDIDGNSVFKQVAFEIASAVDNDPELDISATLNATSANAKTEIKFAKTAYDYKEADVLKGTGDFLEGETGYKIVLARKISGGKFSVNGTGITAYNAGRYSVEDKFIVVDATNVEDEFAFANAENGEKLISLLEGKSDSTAVVVKDNTAVKLEVQGLMPVYSAIGEPVVVPVVAGFSGNESASKITLDIKSPKGLTIKPEGQGTDSAPYTFKATENGSYTLTYKVKVGEKDEATFVYTVKAGDLVLPTITMDGTHSATMTAGDTFTFLKLTATDNKTTDTSKLTVKKEILGPDGNVVGTSVSGAYTTNAGKQTSTTLSASGKYTVKYTVTDEAGNTAVKAYDITVTSASSNSGISLATLSTIMIIVGVLLIAGVVAYLFIFRKPKKNN